MAERETESILMISDFYPPDLGGRERLVADLGAQLSARGHTVQVAALWHEGRAHHERDGAIVVHRLRGTTQRLPFLYARSDRPFHPPCADPLLTLQLRRLIAQQRPAIVHGHSWMLLSALPLQRRFGFATVATLHDYGLLCPTTTLLYRERRPCAYGLSRHCLPCAGRYYGPAKGVPIVAAFAAGRRAYGAVDAFTAISAHSAAAHRRDPLMARARMEAIPNFVPDELLERPIGPPLPDLPDDYLLFVGALGRHKGIHVLLDAYRSLRSILPLVLIGPPGPDTPHTFPPNVIARPGLGHAEVIRAMDHARFLICPAVWDEPFGLVLIEAMARGKSVVASRVGALPEIVRDGETGLLVAPRDVPALAAAMRLLLGDPERARRMGRAGAARCAAHFSAHAVVGRVETLYREARAGAARADDGRRP